jgi:opine dehydrogenase
VAVMLYAHPHHRRNAEALKRAGYIEAIGKIEGQFHLDTTSDIEEAVRFAQIIVVTVPSYGHETILKELGRFDLSQHLVISITGNFFALAARKLLNAQAILETSTSPYASRMHDTKVLVMGIKKVLPIASLPTNLSLDWREKVGHVFGMALDWRSHVLEIGLSCITGVIHPTPALLNTGWIEATGGNFFFYREGMSPSVTKVITAVDNERMAIARAFGIAPQPVVAIMNRYYGQNFSDFLQFARETSEHNVTKMAPTKMTDRFIVQDIPFVLVPWYQLGLKVEIRASTIRSLIDLASVINGTNYLENGRNLDRLGLSRASPSEILAIANAISPAATDEPRVPDFHRSVREAKGLVSHDH